MKYEVTISMPVYNVRNFIERSLTSALNQTFGNIEFLIVDDRGQDDSMEIVRRIQKEHPRGSHIRIVEHDANAGLGMARNTAIDKAKGRYLYFMDSDDYIAPETIQHLYDVMLKENVDVVAASDYEDVDGKIRRRYMLPCDVERGDYAIAQWMEKTKFYFPIHTWNKLYNIDFLRNNDIRCIVGHMVEDTWFTFQVVMKAKSIATISDYTYYYYINPNSHSRQKRDEDFFKQYLEIFIERKRLFESTMGEKPKTLVTFFLDPFYYFFIREALFVRKKGKYCILFLKQMESIYKMNINSSNLVGIQHKIIHLLLKYRLFFLLKSFYIINDKMWGLYNALSYRWNISALPYKHF